MLLALIIACEIGFWVLIVLGLLARYTWRRPRAGLVLLALTPVVDLVLLVATTVDLARGATATVAHGLAAAYIGVSVAYGHKMIRWADTRFAHRYAGGPAPVRLYGRQYAVESWKDVVRTLVAFGIATGILRLVDLVAGDAGNLDALTGFSRVLGLVVVIDLLWAISYTVWPKAAPRSPA
ncbi:hypothetical protein [Cellulomonas chengniuliangii]|uniref:Integral membrane protein n=1 Tax=Cellulomonas chengniuliangii TaxID=2968084 RepID=A0ABY5L4T7_9CELL|nr:hypothetical protein [Cellulomonas chengniuliangii]MCC2308308.1 hypothetical protein [Cellulomonas chengniuliangii]MCC2317315.1 hypothetical protein [Cellulomonas chengniuliangii]UUI76691.1 hypothetical protein NP064_07370 [Cellulomonas chengniuliangii]